MPNTYSPNDDVYVPALKVGIENAETAIKKATVVETNGRSVTVSLPGGRNETIGTRLVHRDVSLLILRISDFSNELTLLDPLTKSLLQFSRILLPEVKLERIRTWDEFQQVWERDHLLFTHVVLVAHCDGESVLFASGKVTAAEFGQCFSSKTSSPQKVFVSLACQSGKADFAKQFSAFPVCRAFIGPFQPCHGAVASQFCQTLLSWHFLEGMTLKRSFNKSKACPGGTSFRYWKDGKIVN